MPGQVSRPDHVLTEAASHSRQSGRLQVEGLPRLNGELGAAAVPQRQTVGTLQEQTHTVSVQQDVFILQGAIFRDTSGSRKELQQTLS